MITRSGMGNQMRPGMGRGSQESEDGEYDPSSIDPSDTPANEMKENPAVKERKGRPTPSGDTRSGDFDGSIEAGGSIVGSGKEMAGDSGEHKNHMGHGEREASISGSTIGNRTGRA